MGSRHEEARGGLGCGGWGVWLGKVHSFTGFVILVSESRRDLLLSATAASVLLMRLQQENTSLGAVTSLNVTMRVLSSNDALSRLQHEGAIFQ